ELHWPNPILSTYLCCARRGRGQNGIRPMQFTFNVEIHPLYFRDGRSVAAVQPNQQARMTAHTQYLGAERHARHGVILRCPLRPSLPYIATTPTRQHED